MAAKDELDDNKPDAKADAKAPRGAPVIRQVEVAARGGGGDLDANPSLRTMVDKAKGASVPNDTIERAIKRATGDLEGVNYESATYEGYAAEGVAVFVEALTDNRNRTSADVRHLFSKNGGSIAEPGAVAWQFERRGIIAVDRAVSEDDVMLTALDAGAEDIVDEGDSWRVTCQPTDLGALCAALEAAKIAYSSADVTWLPKATVALNTVAAAQRVLRLIDALDDHDDIQDVYANFDIPDEILQAVDA